MVWGRVYWAETSHLQLGKHHPFAVPGLLSAVLEDLTASGELVLVAQATTVSYQKRRDGGNGVFGVLGGSSSG